MSEAPAESTPVEAASENEQPTASETPAQETDWKAEARKWETRAKENKAAADKLTELEKANLSELDRAKQAAEEASNELAKLREDNIKQKVALSKGVPADLMEFLGSGSEEEITARADVLVARLSAPTTPKPDLSQGAKGDTAKPSTAQQFADQLGDF